MRCATLFGVMTLAVILSGCGDPGPERFPVAGTVTFDGAPLAEGDILLVPANPGLAPDAGRIVAGRFSFPATAGEKVVQIMASREVPGKSRKGAMGEDIPVREDFIPPKYNVQSELTVDVAPSPNEFAIELESH